MAGGDGGAGSDVEVGGEAGGQSGAGLDVAVLVVDQEKKGSGVVGRGGGQATAGSVAARM